jgi:hypothetical protein
MKALSSKIGWAWQTTALVILLILVMLVFPVAVFA